jgi:hypothetical protein
LFPEKTHGSSDGKIGRGKIQSMDAEDPRINRFKNSLELEFEELDGPQGIGLPAEVPERPQHAAANIDIDVKVEQWIRDYINKPKIKRE